MQRRRKRRGFDRQPVVPNHIQPALEVHMLEGSDSLKEAPRLRAAAQENMRAVVDKDARLGVPKRTRAAAKRPASLNQNDGDSIRGEFAGAGYTRDSAAYDRSSGRYDLPPDSLERTNARAAIATLLLFGTEIDFWNTS